MKYWKENGGDLLIGNQRLYTVTGTPRGPGGMVAWMARPRGYTAIAWTPKAEWRKHYKTQAGAQRGVLKWLAAKACLYVEFDGYQCDLSYWHEKMMCSTCKRWWKPYQEVK